jgi:AraC-like DNA-binding protein
MKALPFKIPHGSKESIKVDHDVMPHFYDTYHTHEELQIMMIIRGHGSAYIGDKILPFEEDDIFFLGQNLPHVFKDKADAGCTGVESISIFFAQDFMGQGFLSLPESGSISTLLEESKRGIHIRGLLQQKITESVWNMHNNKGLNRLLLLVDTLAEITRCQELIFITSPGYHKPKRSIDGHKINDIFDFTLANYTREVTLAEIANVAHMSPTAFCRYFKHHTRKTYTRFLNEIRVGQAGHMLVEDDFSVSQIGYCSGFNNTSNFYRQFKKITGFTPADYRNQYRQ